MTKLKIQTEWLDDGMLTAHRKVTLDDTVIETPTAAIETDKIRDHEPVSPDARGVNELYRTVGGDDLTKSRRGTRSTIIDDLSRGYRKTNEDELTVAFVSYDETGILPRGDAAHLVDILDSVSDVIPVPLMPKTAEAIDPDEHDGTNDPAYKSLRKSIENVLDAVDRRAPATPVMGVLPMLGWDYIEDLLDLYERRNVRAFCLDFNRRKITAANQVAVLRPLMKSISTRGIEDKVLTYGINLHPGSKDDAMGFRSAADFASFGLGLDILGGRHVPPKMPSHVFEDGETAKDEITFRLFDKTDGCYREISLANLPSVFPDDSALDASHIVRRCQNSPKNAKFRLQKLVNCEQKSLAGKEIQSEFGSGNPYTKFTSKPGISPSMVKSFGDVREGFDDGRDQTGLSEF